jgi:hypothetical protein
MQIPRIGFLLLAASLLAGFSAAQAPANSPAPAKRAAAAAGMPIESNLIQLMRGIFYPNSNVIFFAQSQDPTKVPQAKDAATATDPLQNAYGKWEAVENSALAIAEAANLLTLPGRKCQNGRDVPLRNADWAKFVQEVRAAGRKAYKAAQSKNQDNILDAADTLTTSCSNCHDKYREVTTRCM